MREVNNLNAATLFLFFNALHAHSVWYFVIVYFFNEQHNKQLLLE